MVPHLEQAEVLGLSVDIHQVLPQFLEQAQIHHPAVDSAHVPALKPNFAPQGHIFRIVQQRLSLQDFSHVIPDSRVQADDGLNKGHVRPSPDHGRLRPSSQ